jgi:hypothetical protein
MAGVPEPEEEFSTGEPAPGHHKDLVEEMNGLQQQGHTILLERAFASASVRNMLTVLVAMKSVMEHVIELKSLLLLLLMLQATVVLASLERKHWLSR